MSLSGRIRRKSLRQRRKHMAARNFIQVWGLGGLLRILFRWPPGAYLR